MVITQKGQGPFRLPAQPVGWPIGWPACNRPGLLAYLIPQTHEERTRSDEVWARAEG